MTTIHPHWQQTEGDEPLTQPVDSIVREQPVAHVMPSKRTVSRRPAAVLGIIAAVATGFVMTQDLSTLMQAQLTSTGIEVRITQEGLRPPVVTVKQGENITWINDDLIPHLLTIEELMMDDEESFKTSSIFPNERQTVTIPSDAEPGTYTYISETSEKITGQIIIEMSDGTVTASSVAEVSFSSKAAAGIPVFSASSSVVPLVVEQPVPSSVASSSVRSFMAVPMNPHVTGYVQPTTLPDVVSHQPIAHTQSGPALWLAVAGSLACLWFWTRGSFRRVEQVQGADRL